MRVRVGNPPLIQVVGTELRSYRRTRRAVAGGCQAIFGGFGGKQGAATPDIDVQTVFEMPERVVAVGYVHGDVEAMLG